MRTYYAVQEVYSTIDVIKVKAEDKDDAYDMVDHNNGSTIILTAKEANSVANSILRLRRR